MIDFEVPLYFTLKAGDGKTVGASYISHHSSRNRSVIGPARYWEAQILTEISFSAKRFWRYPEEYPSVWREELTTTPDYINANEVWVYEEEGGGVGYYSLAKRTHEMVLESLTLKQGLWPDHMFLLSSGIRTGIGRQ